MSQRSGMDSGWWMAVLRRKLKHGAGGRFRPGWAEDVRTLDAALDGDPEARRRMVGVMRRLRIEWDTATVRDPASPPDLVGEAFERLKAAGAVIEA